MKITHESLKHYSNEKYLMKMHYKNTKNVDINYFLTPRVLLSYSLVIGFSLKKFNLSWLSVIYKQSFEGQSQTDHGLKFFHWRMKSFIDIREKWFILYFKIGCLSMHWYWSADEV